MRGLSGIEDGVDPAIEVFQHMVGASRADAAEAIGAGRGDRDSGPRNQRLGDRMRRHADTNQRPSRGHDKRDCIGSWQQQSQGTRPKG